MITARVGAGASVQGGSDGSPSTVRLPSSTITAPGGKQGTGSQPGTSSQHKGRGGAGYSGGGGHESNGYPGGYNGGPGQGTAGGPGGSGTGEDVTTYALTHFTLSPGQGGQWGGHGGQFGGGGGGVLVGGAGPARDHTQGEGYGGGGGGKGPEGVYFAGLPGVILVEVV